MQKRFGLQYEKTAVLTSVNVTGRKPHYYSLNTHAADFGYQSMLTSLDGVSHETKTILQGGIMRWSLGMNRQICIRELSNQRIFRFLCVGVLNTFFGYAVYAILIFVNVPYLTALFVATVAGVIFNYFSFGRMVFAGLGGWFVFGKFVLAYGVVYAANAALLRALTENFLFSPYVGQVICIPLSVLLSWLLMNYWVYKKD